MQLPGSFIKAIAHAPGLDKDAFIRVHAEEEKVTSIRLNPLKPITAGNGDTGVIRQADKAVPWCPQGYYLPQRPSFTLDPVFHAGAYYVQEASSMFLWHVLQSIVPADKQPMRVLDLCAAPGGKSTLLASFFRDSLLVSNEIIKTRAGILVENLSKWGQANVVVTNNDPRDFAKLEGYFDVIVVDAPCSGSGLFRRDPSAIEEWSEASVQLCSQRQQRILADILPALKPGGKLIYSTCSYSPEEDEEIVDWLVDNFALQNIALEVPAAWGIVTSTSPQTQSKGYRFYPDKIMGEGFFIAAFEKTDGHEFTGKKPALSAATKQEIALLNGWLNEGEQLFFLKQNDNILAIPAIWQQDVALLQKQLYLRKAGVTVGTPKTKDFVPDHQLALSLLISGSIQQVDLSKEEALAYLRKQDFPTPQGIKGWTLATFDGLQLGWMKVLPNRVNNYYPTEWRILKN